MKYIYIYNQHCHIFWQDALSEDEELDNLPDGFLNIELDSQLRALLEDDEGQDDEQFHGFYSALPDLPDPDWRNTQDSDFHHDSFSGVSGPTFREKDYFQLYLDDDFIGKIVRWTNDNASSKIQNEPTKNKTKWSEVESVSEVKAFFGNVLFIELYFSGRIEELWNTNSEKFLLDFPGVIKVFTRERFVQILRYLHFSPEGLARGCRQNPDYDKLYKVRPLLNHVRVKCQDLYELPRDVSLDEGMVPFKGRLGFKQYHKDKPCKWGIKVWMLCDSASGYLFNFEVYMGKNADSQQTNAPSSLTLRVVIDLCKPIVQTGRHLYIDRFYTSRALLYHLRRMKIYTCGTVMINRGFPHEIVPATNKELERGTHLWRLDHSSGILAVTWQDQKPISFMSSIHQPSDEPANVRRHTKQGVALQISAPTCVVDYNEKMGGVDLNDRMTKLDKSRKTYHWYNRLSRKAMLWCAYNAFILEGHFRPHTIRGKRKRDFRSFLVELIHELIGNFP